MLIFDVNVEIVQDQSLISYQLLADYIKTKQSIRLLEVKKK